MKNLLPAMVFALFAMVLTMQTGYAETFDDRSLQSDKSDTCGSSKRVDSDDSWCLEASLTDNDGNLLKKSQWTLKNICTGYRNVLRFLMDIVGGSDFVYDVKSNEKANGSARNDIRKAHCCKDSAPTVIANVCEIKTKANWILYVHSHCTTVDPDSPYCVDDVVDWALTY